MILELGLLCNVYVVYLLLRSYYTPNEVTLSSPYSNKNNRKTGELDSLKGNAVDHLLGEKDDFKDYHLTTRRVSKVLQSRITNQVLISQLIYLLYWWIITQQLSNFGNDPIQGVNLQELYLFDGLILLSNNTLLYQIIINIFAFLSYQVCMNGQGSNVSIDGRFINNSFNTTNPGVLLSGEASLIILGNIIGIDLLLTSNNQILALISWEQINICIYSLISINNNKTKVQSNSIKYFIISAVSTTLFILGITIIYMETGSFNYTNINYQVNMEQDNYLLQVGTVFIYFTILLKLGGAPLHFWAPDLYSSQPSNITQWQLVVPKLGNLLLLLNLYNQFNPSALYSEQGATSFGNNFIIIVGILSMLVGCVSLQSQVKIKRFFAFSSICHVGFLQLSLTFNGFNSYIHYLIIYALTTINIFIIISLYNSNNLSFIQFTLPSYLSKSPLTLFSKYTRSTALSLFIVFSLNMFSLAGIPPLAGFFAKQGVQGAILSDYVIGVYNIVPGMLIQLLFIQASVISGYNYIRLIGLQLNVAGPENLEFVRPISQEQKKASQEREASIQSMNLNSQYTIGGGSSILFDILSVLTIVIILYIVL